MQTERQNTFTFTFVEIDMNCNIQLWLLIGPIMHAVTNTTLQGHFTMSAKCNRRAKYSARNEPPAGVNHRKVDRKSTPRFFIS